MGETLTLLDMAAPIIPGPLMDALRAAQARGALPTSLDTAGLRELGAEILARSTFTARGTSAVYADQLKRLVEQIAGGNLDAASMRVTLLETLRMLGHTPEGGFPDAPAGSVPPALRGTLQDLSSARRLNLIIDTQRGLMRGAGWQARGSTPHRLQQFPAWELVRVQGVHMPRAWKPQDGGTPPIRRRVVDARPRWTIAGGRLYDGRMIALKGDPVWGELGSYENFDDALGVDHPPFAFNSGMGWREIDRGEVASLGVRGPNGETAAEYHGGENRPRTMAGPLPQTPPSINVSRMDPAIRERFEITSGAVSIGGTAVPGDRAQELRDRMAARLAKSIADRQTEYAGRGE